MLIMAKTITPTARQKRTLKKVKVYKKNTTGNYEQTDLTSCPLHAAL